MGHQMFLIAITFSLFLFTSCQTGNANHTLEQHPLVTNAPGSPILFPDGPGNVVIGDVNNDKKLDLVVAVGKTKSIAVLSGKGDGQFAPISITKVPDSPGE